MNRLNKMLPAFLITLIVMVGCNNEEYNFDDLPPVVKSFFTFNAAEQLNINEAIQFNNESQDAVSYTWDFGDGTSSIETNPTKTYTSPGAYTVKLTAVGPGGTGNYSVNLAVIDPDAVIDTDKELYFINHGSSASISKIALVPGATSESVTSIVGKLGAGLTYDEVNEKIYYSEFGSASNGKIWRMNIDGSDEEEIVTGINTPYGIGINLNTGKIYWGDVEGNLSRANLDGSGLQKSFINIPGTEITGVAYNSKTDKIYFYDIWLEDLYVANSDGSGATKVIEDVFGYAIFIDEVNDKIYFEDRKGGTSGRVIKRANLDGSGIETFVSLPNTQVYGLAIDYDTDKFYWMERTSGTVRRVNFDGTEAETVLSGLNNPRGIFIK